MDEYRTVGEYRYSEKGSATTALTFLFIGIGVGTIVALLFAPKSGKQFRRNIRRKYEDAVDAVDELRDQAGEYVDRGRDWARDARDKVEPFTRRLRRD